VPTIGEIQRTTALLALFAAAILLTITSAATAASCILGAALMAANLFALSWVVRIIFALARPAGGATALGLIAAPIKMLLFAALTFLVVESGRVNIVGFIAGTLTQFAAIFIEVGRASIGNRCSPGVSDRSES